MTGPRGWIYTTSRDMTFKSRAPDQKSELNPI